mmetsp:Transcript_33427/g.93827  ORF Transcript_33427/g.93827 Transcript_33427/m.93827 type:complete len:261 (-) Transcript_33427:435-1217(-)
MEDFSTAREEFICWIFRVDSHLDSVTLLGQPIKLQVINQGGSLCNPNLGFNEIELRRFLCNRMFNLEASVDFEEVEVLSIVKNEFHRAGPRIIDTLSNFNGRPKHTFPRTLRHSDGRRFLDNLLISALQRTFALKYVHDVTMIISKYLHLNMAYFVKEPFENDPVISKVALCLSLGALDFCGEIFTRPDDPHAFSASPRSSFDKQGVPHLLSFGQKRLQRLVLSRISRNERYIGIISQDSLCLRFRPHNSNRLRRRTHEN